MDGYGITKMLVGIGLRVKREILSNYMNEPATLCSVNEHTEMKLKIYLSDASMCSEFGYQCPIAVKKGL